MRGVCVDFAGFVCLIPCGGAVGESSGMRFDGGFSAVLVVAWLVLWDPKTGLWDQDGIRA